MTQLRSDVWSFALALYDRPGVSEACLTLQDEHAADVVLLIGICWLSLRMPEALQASDIARLEAALVPWREAAVVPLRTIRRSLKPRLAALPAALGDGGSIGLRWWWWRAVACAANGMQRWLWWRVRLHPGQ